MTSAVLELEQLTKVYRPGLFRKPIPALQGLDLTVREGEIYGFLGVNGSGKTTTFKIVLGLLRATSGRGVILGRPLGDRMARKRIGFLPELPAYYPHLTGREVLRFARDLSDVPRDETADARLLEELGVGDLGDRPIRRLSKGQLQRLGLAQALVHEPELLILDEPMSGLDPVARGLVKDRLRAERAAGRTLILSTHVLADVETLADRVGLLYAGRVTLEGNPQELLSGSVQEVLIQGTGRLGDNILEGLPEGSHLIDGDAWSIRLHRPEPFQVDGCLRRVIKAGGCISSVESRREDLEKLFLRTMEQEVRSCGS